MRAKEYPLLCQAVETGVKHGWNRAHKHDAEPPDDQILDAIVSAVTSEICEAFEFDEAVTPPEEKEKCQSCKKRPANGDHECPFAVEINDNHMLCNCCDECTNEHAMDI